MATVLRLDCPHCPTNDVAFTIAWSAQANSRVSHSIWYATALCGSCGGPVTVRLKNKDDSPTPPQNYGISILQQFMLLNSWPERQKPDAPPHTPDPVKRRFLEGEKSYQQESWNAAVAMYRSALDIATKAMPEVPAGMTFYNRLVWLHDNHRITPDMKIWADHVRVEGNDALHDPEDFTKEDATPLRLFTETFLRYVFELPGEVRAFRGQPD